MIRAAGVVLSVAILTALLVIFLMEPAPPAVTEEITEPFREMLWNLRPLDLIGQMMIILTGAFGVLVLTKKGVESE